MGWHFFPVALERGWLEGADGLHTPKPSPGPSALALSSTPLSRQQWSQESGAAGLLGKGPHSH